MGHRDSWFRPISCPFGETELDGVCVGSNGKPGSGSLSLIGDEEYVRTKLIRTAERKLYPFSQIFTIAASLFPELSNAEIIGMLSDAQRTPGAARAETPTSMEVTGVDSISDNVFFALEFPKDAFLLSLEPMVVRACLDGIKGSQQVTVRGVPRSNFNFAVIAAAPKVVNWIAENLPKFTASAVERKLNPPWSQTNAEEFQAIAADIKENCCGISLGEAEVVTETALAVSSILWIHSMVISRHLVNGVCAVPGVKLDDARSLLKSMLDSAVTLGNLTLERKFAEDASLAFQQYFERETDESFPEFVPTSPSLGETELVGGFGIPADSYPLYQLHLLVENTDDRMVLMRWMSQGDPELSYAKIPVVPMVFVFMQFVCMACHYPVPINTEFSRKRDFEFRTNLSLLYANDRPSTIFFLAQKFHADLVKMIKTSGYLKTVFSSSGLLSRKLALLKQYGDCGVELFDLSSVDGDRVILSCQQEDGKEAFKFALGWDAAHCLQIEQGLQTAVFNAVLWEAICRKRSKNELNAEYSISRHLSTEHQRKVLMYLSGKMRVPRESNGFPEVEDIERRLGNFSRLLVAESFADGEMWTSGHPDLKDSIRSTIGVIDARNVIVFYPSSSEDAPETVASEGPEPAVSNPVKVITLRDPFPTGTPSSLILSLKPKPKPVRYPTNGGPSVRFMFIENEVLESYLPDDGEPGSAMVYRFEELSGGKLYAISNSDNKGNLLIQINPSEKGESNFISLWENLIRDPSFQEEIKKTILMRRAGMH